MFGKKKRIDLLEQTQINLMKTQENLERTRCAVDKLFEDKESTSVEVVLRKAPDVIPEKTYDEKWKAAYALNLCTVSVSQIVEYDDIRTLDQEYTTILNNLNLQNFPKDDALFLAY